jgi:retinol dehydrogenase-12
MIKASSQLLSIRVCLSFASSSPHKSHGSFSQRIAAWLIWDVSYGALTQLYAGTALDAAKLGGQYLVPWARVGTPRADTQDPQLGKELWAWLEEQVTKL